MSARLTTTTINGWVGLESKQTKTPRKPQRTPSSTRAWHRLEEKWNGIQVGRQGSYSVERLESLQFYCSTKSWNRVILVIVLTPLPALLLLLFLECLPLRPPAEGWSANWMFWIRMSLMVFTLTFVGISDMILFVPNLGFTFSKRFIVSMGSTVGYVGTWLLATATHIIGFPIPFMWQFGGLLLGVYLPVMLLLVFGSAPFARNSPLRLHLERYLRLLFGFMALAGVFPLYKVVYDLVPVAFRGGALIALPIWKFGAKHFIMWCSRELEDFMPMIVALTVDLFSSLFVSVCISTSGPLYLSVLFIAADIGQGLLEFREVRANSQTILEILHERVDPITTIQDFASTLQGSNLNCKAQSNSTKPDLLAKITAVSRNPTAFNVVSLKRTRLWACLPHPMTADQVKQLDGLEDSRLYGPRGLLSARRTSRRKSRHQSLPALFIKSVSIVPSISKAGSTKALKATQGEKSRRLVVEGLQLLFHCEYLALVEYIECVVPLVFVTYKLVLRQLPNAVYYPAASNWGVGTITNVLVYATLEVVSLLLLHHLLQRKFDFSPLYQLAFALETQMYLVQANLFVEIVILLQYELAHLGVDFTFRYEWLRNAGPRP